MTPDKLRGRTCKGENSTLLGSGDASGADMTLKTSSAKAGSTHMSAKKKTDADRLGGCSTP